MLRIDHIALGVQNLFEGAERLRAETGLGDREGGWFPGIGAANRIAALGPRQYLEVESVIDAVTAERTAGGRWFLDQLRAGDVFLGWCAGVDSREELDRYAEWFGVPVEETVTRVAADGSVRGSPRTPSAPEAWRRGLPNVFYMDPDTHPANDAPHGREPGGIAWMEVGGTERDMREWLGSGVDDLPLRFNHRPHGVYAVAVRSSPEEHEIVIRRRPVLLGQ